MKKIGIKLIVLGAVFLAGYIPMYLKNRAQRQSSEQALLACEARITDSQDQLRVSRLVGTLGLVLVEVEQNNFGKAKELSTRFFDDLRQAEASARSKETRERLRLMLNRRDEITSDLTALSAAVASKIRSLYVELHGS